MQISMNFLKLTYAVTQVCILMKSYLWQTLYFGEIMILF